MAKRISFLRKKCAGGLAALSAGILTLLGVITSACGGDTATAYGVPGVYVQGRITTDGTSLPGMKVSLLLTDSTTTVCSGGSDQYGRYELWSDDSLFDFPDSAYIRVEDIDGAAHGTFLTVDSLIHLEADEGGTASLFVDFELEPEEEQYD